MSLSPSTVAEAPSALSRFSFRNALPVALALAGVCLLIWLGQNIASFIVVRVSPLEEVNQRFSYQLIALVMTALFLVCVFWLRPQAARRFARLGHLSAPAVPIPWLGIRAKDTWRSVGFSFAFWITLTTSLYLYFGILSPQSIPLTALLPWLPIALLLAVSNAFVEEALTRFGIVAALHGAAPNAVIYLIAALVFGLPHYFGVPGGLVGALMSAFLGWLLARSVVETQGVFWAWFLHFLQDVVIFVTLLSQIPA